VAAVAVALAGCGSGDGLATGGASSPSVAASSSLSATATEQSDIVAGTVEIGDGRSLYRICRGDGSPTVILESGDGGDSFQWQRVMPGIGEVTTVCAYDRGGLGRSSPVSGCRHLEDLTGDLAQLLEAADIPGPYVLVGTSGGGYISVGFAAERPDDVAGIVLLDTSRAFPDPPPELIEGTACDAPDNEEHRDYLAVEHEAWDDRGEIGDIPVTVVTVEYANPEHAEEAMNVEGQQSWLVLSPQAEQMVVHTAHDMANADPELVIEEVTKVVEAARGGDQIDY
jgi:pimeloyl-ACP methyl ester carboxylesterase